MSFFAISFSIFLTFIILGFKLAKFRILVSFKKDTYILKTRNRLLIYNLFWMFVFIYLQTAPCGLETGIFWNLKSNLFRHKILFKISYWNILVALCIYFSSPTFFENWFVILWSRFRLIFYIFDCMLFLLSLTTSYTLAIFNMVIVINTKIKYQSHVVFSHT